MALAPAVLQLVALLAVPPALPLNCKEEAAQLAIVIRCPGAIATATLGDASQTLEGYTRAAVTGIKAQIGVEPKISSAALTLGGKKIDVTAYEVSGAVGWLAVLPRPQATLWLGCQGKGPQPAVLKTCTALLERLVVSNPPSAVAPRSGPLPKIAGKPLSVPKECSYDGSEQISCEDGNLWWLAPSPVPLAKSIAVLLENSKTDAASRKDTACTVGGAKGQCYDAVKKGADGKPLMYVLFGELPADGKYLYFVCDSMKPLAPKLPAVCTQVFAR